MRRPVVAASRTQRAAPPRSSGGANPAADDGEDYDYDDDDNDEDHSMSTEPAFPQPKCDPPRPSDLPANVFPETHSSGSAIVYKCRETVGRRKFTLFGESVAVCIGNMWSSPPPKCLGLFIELNKCSL